MTSREDLENQEALGEESLRRQQAPMLSALAAATDRESLLALVADACVEMDDIQREQIREWGKLSVEQKDARLRGMVRPHLPHWLEEMEREYGAGQKTALFAAIKLCAEFSVPLPDWVAAAFLDGYKKVERSEVDSWDAAFGRPRAASQRLPNVRRQRELLWTVHHCVTQARERHPGRPLDLIWGDVGEELGIGWKLVKDLYGKARKQHADPAIAFNRWTRVIPSGDQPRRLRKR